MQNIKQKTKYGMLWNAFDKIFVQGLTFVLSIILARLLSPEDYGLIGMLSIFVALSNVFIESGFSRALIQKQNRSEVDYSTVFIFNVFVSIILYGILFISSPYIAQFYKEPKLLPVQRVFFLILIVNSLTTIQTTKLQVEVNFKKLTIINALSSIFSGLIGILAAYNDLGVWALVIQMLSKSIFTFIFLWITNKWLPTAGFSFSSFKELFNYGSKLLITGAYGVVLNNIRDLFIGKTYSPSSLGYYTRAKQFPEVTVGTMSGVLNTATFPLLASLQNDKENLVNIFTKLIQTTALLTFPAMIGLAILSEPIILVLLGEKWLFASELLFWLSLSYIFTPFSVLNLNVLNAIGRSDLFMKVDFSKAPIIILTMIITFPISLKAVAIGNAITALFYFYINAFMIGRLFNFGGTKQLLISWRYIVSSFIMGFVLFFLIVVLKTKNIPYSLSILFFLILIGAIIYLALLFLLKDSILKQYWTLLKNKISNIKGIHKL